MQFNELLILLDPLIIVHLRQLDSLSKQILEIFSIFNILIALPEPELRTCITMTLEKTQLS